MRTLSLIIMVMTIPLLIIMVIANTNDINEPRFTIGDDHTIYTEYHSDYVCQFGVAYNKATSRTPATVLVDANNKPLTCAIIK